MRPEQLPHQWSRKVGMNNSNWNIWQLIQQHWLKIILLGLLLYLMSEKNVSFSIKMGGANLSAVNPFEVSTSPVKFFDQEGEASMSLSEYVNIISPEEKDEGGLLPEDQGAEEWLPINEPVPEPPSPESLESLSPQVRNMGNLTLVLSPDFISRHKVPRFFVEQKMQHIQQYVKRFAPIAQAEMKKYGIPASIKLAQGLLESNVGDSRLAKTCNNHFGIKCFSRTCARGHCSNFTDDSHKDFFRNYDSAWESYRAHSRFLQKDRYIHLKKLGTRDYRNWAHGLKKAGYATDKRYAQKLIKIIETLKLDQYDS
jgi:flagellum-specific peptidoglycan hydrolase FlgJ